MMKRFAFLFIFASIILTSCNWNVITGNIDKITGNNDLPEVPIFTGKAPTDLYASKGSYKDRVTISFGSVSGATYYNIYRAGIEKGTEVKDYDTLDWSLLDVVESESTRRITYIDEITEKDDIGRSRDNAEFYYRVKAGSEYADTFLSVNPEYSDVAVGWTLSSPKNISATQGAYLNRIELVWDQVYGVDGYNLYYSTDYSMPQNLWTLLASNIPYSENTESVGQTFYPPSTIESGSYVYFAVESIGHGNKDSSEWSTYARGFTFKEGQPDAPKNTKASQAEFADSIVVSWDKPNVGTGIEYTWEVFRNDLGEAEPLISFTESNMPENVKLEGNVFRFTDNDSSLEPNTVYTYKVSAYYYSEPDENGESEFFAGAPSSAEGFLLSVPDDISVEIVEPSGSNNGGYNFTIGTPLGWSLEKNWTYKIEGRHNDGVGNTTSWQTVKEAVPVLGITPVEIYAGTEKLNDFRIYVSNGSVKSKPGDTIQADVPAPISFEVLANTWADSISPNSNGVYPVLVKFNSVEGYAKFTVNCITLKKTVEYTAEEAAGGKMLSMGAENSPDEPFEIYVYQATGESPFGRKIVSDAMNGYGALTGDAFIKYFQVFSLKPWEYAGKNLLGPELSEKWKQDQNGTQAQLIAWKIAQGNKSSISDQMNSLTKGGAIEAAGLTGTISYFAEMQGFGGHVEFTYSNFGEHEGMANTGKYEMNVDASGTGSVTGSLNITGMYPALIEFDASKISVVNKAFSGQYKLTQDNSSGTAYINVSQQVD